MDRIIIIVFKLVIIWFNKVLNIPFAFICSTSVSFSQWGFVLTLEITTHSRIGLFLKSFNAGIAWLALTGAFFFFRVKMAADKRRDKLYILYNTYPLHTTSKNPLKRTHTHTYIPGGLRVWALGYGIFFCFLITSFKMQSHKTNKGY